MDNLDRVTIEKSYSRKPIHRESSLVKSFRELGKILPLSFERKTIYAIMKEGSNGNEGREDDRFVTNANEWQ